VVFGSGARRRGRSLVFVSSCATVDRLQYLELDGTILVSNSLACLLAAAGGRLDPTYPDYMVTLRSVVRGLEHYERILPSNRGPVQLSYCENLRWDGDDLWPEAKPWASRDFRTFASYIAFLDEALGRLDENLSAADRSYVYRMLGTVSSGYDSPMVTVLARRHGLDTALSFPEGRKPLLGSAEPPPEGGDRIGARLGVRVLDVPRDAWQQDADAAIPFLAGDGNGQEVLFKGAERHLAGTVLLTGMSGDTIWGRHAKGGDGMLARGDQSGLSLTEYRLHAGFIHLPLPFIGANQASDLRALSNSPDLAAWSVGGSYDRPICRRVVEEAGIERESFGRSKVAASVRFSLRENFWSAGFRGEFLDWLAARRALWLRRGHLPPAWKSALARPVQRLLASAAHWLHRSRPTWAGGYLVRRRLEYLGGRELLYKYLFPWAVERTSQRYESLPEPGVHEARSSG